MRQRQMGQSITHLGGRLLKRHTGPALRRRYKLEPFNEQLGIVFAHRVSLLPEGRERACERIALLVLVKETEEGNGLSAHLVWPFCSVIDQHWKNKRKILT